MRTHMSSDATSATTVTSQRPSKHVELCMISKWRNVTWLGAQAATGVAAAPATLSVCMSYTCRMAVRKLLRSALSRGHTTLPKPHTAQGWKAVD